MAQKRVTCWSCSRYDREERQCRDGKANPKRKAESVEVAEVLGVSRLCLHNPHREQIALQMFFPRESQSSLERRRGLGGMVSVELEPEGETAQAIAKLRK